MFIKDYTQMCTDVLFDPRKFTSRKRVVPCSSHISERTAFKAFLSVAAAAQRANQVKCMDVQCILVLVVMVCVLLRCCTSEKASVRCNVCRPPVPTPAPEVCS
jgi:hypothetical protein